MVSTSSVVLCLALSCMCRGASLRKRGREDGSSFEPDSKRAKFDLDDAKASSSNPSAPELIPEPESPQASTTSDASFLFCYRGWGWTQLYSFRWSTKSFWRTLWDIRRVDGSKRNRLAIELLSPRIYPGGDWGRGSSRPLFSSGCLFLLSILLQGLSFRDWWIPARTPILYFLSLFISNSFPHP